MNGVRYEQTSNTRLIRKGSNPYCHPKEPIFSQKYFSLNIMLWMVIVWPYLRNVVNAKSGDVRKMSKSNRFSFIWGPCLYYPKIILTNNFPVTYRVNTIIDFILWFRVGDIFLIKGALYQRLKGKLFIISPCAK